MSHPMLIEGCNRQEVRSNMRPGFRILLMLLSIFPLIAPYELIVRIDWHDYLHPFFLPAAFISAGAVVLSLFLIFAALAGLNSQLVFDKKTSTLTYSFEAPLVRRASRIYQLSAINSIDVGKRNWSDGAPSYHLRVVMDNSEVIESGSSWSRDEVEAIRVRIIQFIGGEGA